MIYLKEFDSHALYESEVNVGGVDINLPNVSYCNDVNDVHFNPYNLIEFYVGEITGETPQTVKIYTDSSTSIPIQVSKGNKWYSYVLPKDKGLYKIESGLYDDSEGWSNGIVTKAVVKANINYNFDADKNKRNGIVPWEITEASFKGSDTSNVTDMSAMFIACTNLTSLDLSSFDTSKVTSMNGMFYACTNLTSLTLSNFNTSNVTNMESMFADCSGLASLDLSNFDTSNVTDMGSMFYGCSKLTSLDLSGWDTSKVTSMNGMFEGCDALNTIRMVGCSTETINKIKAQLETDGITRATITTK